MAPDESVPAAVAAFAARDLQRLNTSPGNDQVMPLQHAAWREDAAVANAHEVAPSNAYRQANRARPFRPG